MHPQLEILLQIQDLRSQRDRLSSEESGGEAEIQREAFSIDVDKALAALDRKIGTMEGELDPAVRTRYNRISSGRDRVVAPVIDGTCYACFVSIPTSQGSAGQNKALRSCENCGRFIYLVG